MESTSGHEKPFREAAMSTTATTTAGVTTSADGTEIAYESSGSGPALVLDDTHAPNAPRLPERLQEYVDEGRRGEGREALRAHRRCPGLMVAVMPVMPVWRKLTGVAHTLPYDLSIVI
jgi:hypothetical protein